MRGGSVRQERHLRRNRRTAVPYAQFDRHYPADVRVLSRVLPALRGAPSAGTLPAFVQKTQRNRPAICWRQARGSRAEP
jgi:hypothetical protein